MTPYALAFSAAFVYVALKAMQQLNVVHNHWQWIMPVSIAMCACEFYLVVYMVHVGPSVPSILTIGVGAGLGALATMFFYQRFKGESK